MKFLDVTLNAREPDKVEEEYKKPQYDWCWENNINNGKEIIDFDQNHQHKYQQWRTNNSLSNHVDTLMAANYMNMSAHISDKMHYHYLFHSVRKTKRYGKKKTEQDKKIEKLIKEEQEKISAIQAYYKYNRIRAKEVLKLLSKERLDYIIEITKDELQN